MSLVQYCKRIMRSSRVYMETETEKETGSGLINFYENHNLNKMSSDTDFHSLSYDYIVQCVRKQLRISRCNASFCTSNGCYWCDDNRQQCNMIKTINNELPAHKFKVSLSESSVSHQLAHMFNLHYRHSVGISTTCDTCTHIDYNVKLKTGVEDSSVFHKLEHALNIHKISKDPVGYSCDTCGEPKYTKICVR